MKTTSMGVNSSPSPVSERKRDQKRWRRSHDVMVRCRSTSVLSEPTSTKHLQALSSPLAYHRFSTTINLLLLNLRTLKESLPTHQYCRSRTSSTSRAFSDPIHCVCRFSGCSGLYSPGEVSNRTRSPVLKIELLNYQSKIVGPAALSDHQFKCHHHPPLVHLLLHDRSSPFPHGSCCLLTFYRHELIKDPFRTRNSISES